MTENEYINREEAAKMLGKTPGTLAVWASTGSQNLPYYKVGGKVLYKKSDIVAFIESGRIESGKE